MRKIALVAALSIVALAPQASRAQVRVGVALPGVRVQVGPPAPRYEPVPAAPSPRHQWIAGYWSWRGGNQVWVPGQWVAPPTRGYVWEPARWEQVDRGWMFYDGHWRPADDPDPVEAWQPPPPPVREVVVEAPPPARIEEVRPPMPFPGALWVPGYWYWNGHRHVWVGGRWSPRPAGYGWEEHRWERHDDGRWRERPGHWRVHEDEGHRGPDGHGRHEDRRDRDDHHDHDRRDDHDRR
jgi:hypothetical protein